MASLIPMFAVRYNLWNLGSLFFLGLGIILPVIVAALFVARRVSPATKMRVGSLSVDQFGSVVASFSVAFFFLSIAGAFVPSMLLALVGALGLLAATVLGRLIPFFAGDFLDRAEVPAHIVARESAVPVRKPRAPKAPKEAEDERAPKAAGTSAVAGWAKRMTPGGQSPAKDAAPRGDQSFGAGAGAAGAAAASGAAAGSAAATPPAAQQAPAQQAPAPSAAPAPVSVPRKPRPPPSCLQRPPRRHRPPPSRPRPPPSCLPPQNHAAGDQVPDAQARAAARPRTPGPPRFPPPQATAPPPR